MAKFEIKYETFKVLKGSIDLSIKLEDKPNEKDTVIILDIVEKLDQLNLTYVYSEEDK